MPNKYHDSRGRFASKNEMAAYVDDLQQKTLTAATETERRAAMDEWFALKQQYDAIANKTVTVPADFLRRSTVSVDANKDKPKTIATAYEANIKQHLGPTGWDPNVFQRLLAGKNTPAEVKADILAGLSDGQRTTILNRLVERPDVFPLNKDTMLSVVGKIDSPEKAKAIFANPAFTYDELVDMTREADMKHELRFYGVLGATRPEFINAEHGSLGIRMWGEARHAPEGEKLVTLATLGKYTTSPALQEQLVEQPDFRIHSGVEHGRDDNDPGRALASNPHLDPQVANRLLEKTRDTSIDQYQSIEHAIIQTRDNGGDVRHIKRTPALGLTTVIDGEKFSYSSLPRTAVISTAEQGELAELRESLPSTKPGAFKSAYDRSMFNDSDAKVSRYVSLQAKEDARQENFAALLKELKTLRRRKAPRTQQVSLARRINLAYLMGHIKIED